MTENPYPQIDYQGKQKKYLESLHGSRGFKAVVEKIGLRNRGVQLDGLQPGRRDEQVAAILDAVGPNFLNHALTVSKETGSRIESVEFRMLANAAIVSEQLGTVNHNGKKRQAEGTGPECKHGSLEQYHVKDKVVDAFLGIGETSEESWMSNGIFSQRMDMLFGSSLDGKSHHADNKHVTAEQRRAVLRMVPEMYKNLQGKEQSLRMKIASATRLPHAEQGKLKNEMSVIQDRMRLIQDSFSKSIDKMDGSMKLDAIGAMMKLGNREQDSFMDRHLIPAAWDQLTGDVKLHMLETYSAATVFEAGKIAVILSSCEDDPIVRDALIRKMRGIAEKSKQPWSDVDGDKLVPRADSGPARFDSKPAHKRDEELAATAENLIQDILVIKQKLSPFEARELLRIASDLAIAIGGDSSIFISALEKKINSIVFEDNPRLPVSVMIEAIPDAISDIKDKRNLYGLSPEQAIRHTSIRAIASAEDYISDNGSWQSVSFNSSKTGKERQEALASVIKITKKMTEKRLLEKSDDKKQGDRESLNKYLHRLKEKINKSKNKRQYGELLRVV